MTDSVDAINAEALRILKLLEKTPFDACCPLTREFAELPPRPGIYAVKHKTQGILYLGKSGSVKGRFKGGHKALGLGVHEQARPRRCEDSGCGAKSAMDSLIIAARADHHSPATAALQRAG